MPVELKFCCHPLLLHVTDALGRAGKPCRVLALINDSVGVLTASCYMDTATEMGVILGTGTNACIVDKVRRGAVSVLAESGATQALGGQWSDKYGGSAVLAGGLALWSVATALTRCCRQLGRPAGLLTARLPPRLQLPLPPMLLVCGAHTSAEWLDC
jgi:hypothetical protein